MGQAAGVNRSGDQSNDFLWIGVYRAAVANDATLSEHPNPIDQIKDLAQVVADDDEGDTALFQTFVDVFYFGGFLYPQCSGGFIQDDELMTAPRPPTSPFP